jgi:hypothetical protein
VRHLAFERLVDLGRALPQEEEPAADEDQVTNGDGPAEDDRKRLRQPEDPGDRQQQQDADPHREPETDPAPSCLLLRRQPSRDDREEDDVVDAEHDLQDRQRRQRDPRLGVGQEFHGPRVIEDRKLPRTMTAP